MKNVKIESIITGDKCKAYFKKGKIIETDEATADILIKKKFAKKVTAKDK